MSKGALPGFRDFYPEQFAERAHIVDAWRDIARRFAFVEYDGPPLEPLELFTRKSGEEIAAQLYNFTDKGDREVALRPEMTPTFARMVAAKANALRKPVRWFSIPQLFRYERQQKGRLREHFQLNVDIVGEADVTADAELLAVAVEIMRALGLTPDDVIARVSDRRILSAYLASLGVPDDKMATVFSVIDKLGRMTRDGSLEALDAIGIENQASRAIVDLRQATVEVVRDALANFQSRQVVDDFSRYLEYLRSLGVSDFVRFDLSIVRGLAYYTGIVFELFDAKGHFRAICGGGRYDSLLQALGNVDLPALGFGMGDVVLNELLKARRLQPGVPARPDFWVASEADDGIGDVMEVATALRRSRASVEYALRSQTLSKQTKAAHSAGAAYFVVIDRDFSRSRRIQLEPLGSPGEMPGAGALADRLSGRDATLDSLVEVITDHPRVLISKD